VIGHADINHFLSNFSFILLLGPILEETYGTRILLMMIAATALVTGALNALFFPSFLLGASGVVFMMILLASFTNFNKGEIPLTFILVLILYIGREVISSFRSDNISEFAHIVGGFCGSLFGFFKPVRR
jgi:membrane associated rhomboid family serine protease